MRRIAGRDLFVAEAWLQQAVGRLLAGNVQDTVGSHGGRVDRVPAVPEQQEGKHWRCGMRFNVCREGEGENTIVLIGSNLCESLISIDG